ncbi:HIT-type Zinc finger family protein [Euphorbia peplus]|nr:HIT-type Zinc finger family protein [Euphorbia peplus]
MENHSALMIFPLKRPVSKSGSCQGAYPEEQFPSARKELDLCNPSSMEHYYLQVYGAKENDEVPPGPETCLTPVSLLRTILIKVAPGLLRSLLTQVSKLISTEPSPVLAVHLVDILYSYCFTLNRTSLLSLI